MSNKYFTDQTSDVRTKKIGAGTRIWQFNVILEGAKIGSDVNICSHCFIENDVVIGDRVTVKSGVQLWNGLHIEDDVFIGPNVTLTNDKYPRSKKYPDKLSPTYIKKYASIGGGATILPGITIGEYAMIGAGAIVTKSVPAYGIVKSSAGNLTCFTSTNNRISDEIPDDRMSKLSLNNKSHLYHFKKNQDTRGSLSFGEFLRDIPFIPKRYFLVYDVPQNKIRGGHAHYECHQFLICVSGNCTVMTDNGDIRNEVLLNSPSKGLHIPPLTWAYQYNYTEDAVLLVFTSDYYDTNDYIHDYTSFTNIVSKTTHDIF